MRSAQQIGRTVSEYHEWQAAERRKHLREALALIRQARERGEEWVRWIDDGRPALTASQYAAAAAAPRGRRGRASAGTA